MRQIDRRTIFSSAVSSLLAFVGPLIYGLAARNVFKDRWPDWFGLLTVGFLFLVPFALGALTVFPASPKMRTNWWYAICAPWISCFVFAIVVGVFAWEAWLCVVMALPILLVMSTLGGALFCLIFTLRNRLQGTPTGLLALLLAAPYLLTPLENQFPAVESIRAVETRVVVAADTVWRNIIRLPEIHEAERPVSLFHVAGLPRPMEAMLTREGAGGIRRGQWEDGLAFVGTITDWRPDRGFTVTLKADTHAVHSPLPLQEIGGKYFDMVDDSYIIEPAGDGKVILHLISTYRLTTHFNFYGALWTDFLLRDIQRHILTVVKHRAESAASLNPQSAIRNPQ